MKTRFVTILIFFKVILLAIGGRTVKAMEEDIVKINPDTNVLVVYSTEHWEVDENIRLLDLSIGHFSNNIEYTNIHNLEQSDLEDKTHLFYYGHIKEELPPTFSEAISSFDVPIMSISYNTEQLGEKYSFMGVGNKMQLKKFIYIRNKDKPKEL